MKTLLSLSAKSIGVLYHATTKENAVSILRSGNLILATGRAVGTEASLQSDSIYFASFTRSRSGHYHYGDDGSRTNKVIFTLDGTKLSSKYKIQPVDYWNDNAHRARTEAEERLLSDDRYLPILRYIKRIDVIIPAVAEGKYDKMPSATKEHSTGLSTLVYLSKKLGVPIGFYNSALDWGFKRNEFSPIAKLPAKRAKYADSHDYSTLTEIFSALKLSAEELLESKNRYALAACQFPESSFATFTNHTRAASGPITAIVDRIARLIKRLNLHSYEDFKELLSSKYMEAMKLKDKARAGKEADVVAGSLVRLLTLSRDKLEEKDLLYLNTDPRFTGTIDTRISYYLSRYVEDYGHTPTTAKAYGLLGVTGKALDVYDVLDQVRRRFR